MYIKRFEVLDSFRGLCAIFVAIAHAKVLGLNPIGSISTTDFISNSWLFVEFFFVLSGFVLTHVYGSKVYVSTKQFVISRCFRLLPLHIAILLVFIISELIKIYLLKFNVSFTSEAFVDHNDINNLLPNILLLQSWFASFDPYSFNSPSWTISIEFYVCLFFLLTLKVRANLRLALWLVIACVFATLNYFDKTLFMVYGNIGILCFFLGAMTNHIYLLSHSRFRINYYLISLLELMSIILVYMTISYGPELFVNITMLSSFVFAFVVLLFSYERGIISRCLKFRVLTYFGRLSYSIYLVHWLVISLFIYIFRFPQPIASGSAFYDNLLLSLVVLTIISVAHFTYYKIEVPFIKFGKELAKKLN